jgi:hypothetical protein
MVALVGSSGRENGDDERLDDDGLDDDGLDDPSDRGDKDETKSGEWWW